MSAKRIVSRIGTSLNAPKLIPGEMGYDTDTKVFRVGDDTSTPPGILTSKTEAFDLSNLKDLKLSTEVLELLAKKGTDGWTPVLATESFHDRDLLKVIDWADGVGDKPHYPVYVSPNGYTTDPNLATNVRGKTGSNASGPIISFSIENGNLLMNVLNPDETMGPIEGYVDDDGHLIVEYSATNGTSIQTDLGKILVTIRGPYNPNTTYERLDEVTYNNKLYRVLPTSEPITGIDPTDSNHWVLSYSYSSLRTYNVEVATLEDRDDYNDEDEGFSVLVTDIGDGKSAIYERQGSSGNWSYPNFVILATYDDTVSNPNSATLGNVAVFTDTNGKVIGDGGYVAADLQDFIELNDDLTFLETSVNTHIIDTDNPHNITSKISIAISELNLGSASQADVENFAMASQKVPNGGSTGQILAKTSNVDNDVAWIDNTVGDMLKATYDQHDTVADAFDLYNQYGNKPTTFVTVANLIADTVLDYSAARFADKVEPGNIIEAQGFRYVVADSGVSNHHIETSGNIKLYVLPSENITIEAFGATFSGDESVIAQKMLDAFNILRSPKGKTLTVKNIELSNGTVIDIKGTIALPDACSDYDRLLYGDGIHSVDIYISDIDGNADGQSGFLGTHLLYFARMANSTIRIGSSRTHYIADGFIPTDVDNTGREAYTGAHWFYQCKNVHMDIGYLEGWSREGIMFDYSDSCSVALGHAQSLKGSEDSAIQMHGHRNKILRGSADSCGASSFGFDTVDGIVSNVIATNTMDMRGINLGHTGRPATGTVVSNAVIDGVWNAGIGVGAGSKKVAISNVSIANAERGIQVSDEADEVRVSGGIIKNCRWNLLTYNANLHLANTDYQEIDEIFLTVTVTNGEFQDGEELIGPGGSATIRKAVTRRGGTEQHLFLRDVTGAFFNGDNIYAVTSGSTATITVTTIPLPSSISGTGGIYDGEHSTSGSSGVQIRFANGEAVFRGSVAIDAEANTLETATINYDSQVIWASGTDLNVQASITNVNSTAAYIEKQLRASSTTSAITISLNVDTAQQYSIHVTVWGRWK